MLTEAVREAGLDAEVAVDSSATSHWEIGNPIDKRAAAKLRRHEIDSSSHTARQFELAWFSERDLILALDVDHYEHLLGLAPDATSRSKVRMLREFDPAAAGKPARELGIYDPWFGDEDDFDATWDLILPAIPGIIDHARKALRASR